MLADEVLADGQRANGCSKVKWRLAVLGRDSDLSTNSDEAVGTIFMHVQERLRGRERVSE